MKKNRNKFFHILVGLVLLLGVKTAFASETFNNNLLKAELHKSPLGGVKIVLFTGKPYNDSVTINKKNDLEYTILMPETSNSLTGKPNLKFVSDVVKNIEVKSQPYQNNIKGYTKVVIYTSKPIEILPQVQTLSPVSFKLSEKEYNELIAQATKKPAAKSTPATAPAQKVVTKKIEIPVIKKNETIKHNKKTQKINDKIQSQKENEKSIKKVIKPVITATPVVKAATTKQQEKPISTKTIIKPTSEVNRPVEIDSKPIAPEKINAPIAIEKVVTNSRENVINFSSIKKSACKVACVVKKNLYVLLGGLFAVFILLLLMARKMTTGRKKSQVNFTSNLKEQPNIPINYEEKINEDMTWKEKFQTYKENETSESTVTDDFNNTKSDELEQENLSGLIPTEEELDGLFNQDNYIEENQDIKPNSFDEFLEIEDYDNFTTEITAEDLFNEEESLTEDAAETFTLDAESITADDFIVELDETKEQEEQFVSSEFIIDEQRAFYLVDFENITSLVGRINEEYFVLKRFDSKISAALRARINETNVGSINYMVKAGEFRGIVEVKPNNMSLLIEL